MVVESASGLRAADKPSKGQAASSDPYTVVRHTTPTPASHSAPIAMETAVCSKWVTIQVHLEQSGRKRVLGQTHVVRNELNPVWEPDKATFSAILAGRTDAVLHLAVFDEDYWGSDALGAAAVPLDSYLFGEENEGDEDGESRGQISATCPPSR